ncbi:unnamed protein product, partial [Nesidiocoris tenuis]
TFYRIRTKLIVCDSIVKFCRIDDPRFSAPSSCFRLSGPLGIAGSPDRGRLLHPGSSPLKMLSLIANAQLPGLRRLSLQLKSAWWVALRLGRVVVKGRRVWQLCPKNYQQNSNMFAQPEIIGVETYAIPSRLYFTDLINSIDRTVHPSLAYRSSKELTLIIHSNIRRLLLYARLIRKYPFPCRIPSEITLHYTKFQIRRPIKYQSPEGVEAWGRGYSNALPSSSFAISWRFELNKL